MLLNRVPCQKERKFSFEILESHFDLLVLTVENEAHRAIELVGNDKPDEQPESNKL